MPGATTKVDASEYDLTHKISPFLDAHLVFPLLEFLEENTSYDAGSVQRARQPGRREAGRSGRWRLTTWHTAGPT